MSTEAVYDARALNEGGHLYSPRAIVVSPTLALSQLQYEIFKTLYPNGNIWLASGNIDDQIPYNQYPEVFFCTLLQLLHLTSGLNKLALIIRFSRTETIVLDEFDSIISHIIGKGLASHLKSDEVGVHQWYRTEFHTYNVKKPPPQRIYICTGHSNKNSINESIYDAHKILMDLNAVPIIDQTYKSLNPEINHSFLYAKTEDDKLYIFFKYIERLVAKKIAQRVIVFLMDNSQVSSLYDSTMKHIMMQNYSSRVKLDKIDTTMQSTLNGIRQYFSPSKNSDNTNDGVQILFVSDLYSRGLDFVDIDEVIHYKIAPSLINYVHRTGRTGRFGRKGKSVSILLNSEKHFEKSIKSYLEYENSKIFTL